MCRLSATHCAVCTKWRLQQQGETRWQCDAEARCEQFGPCVWLHAVHCYWRTSLHNSECPGGGSHGICHQTGVCSKVSCSHTVNSELWGITANWRHKTGVNLLAIKSPDKGELILHAVIGKALQCQWASNSGCWCRWVPGHQGRSCNLEH